MKIRDLKYSIPAAAVTALTVASPAFAAGTADSTVTAAFTSMADDVKATLGVVAGIGVTIMAIFLAWKYGRKIFSQVAK